ncbi:hypothetical protein [uncultured Paraglaciecola sp.]|uniref:hypothetical protein n=1 Tax=uncultured Paraglaciecola sp. TaxID=1765024 RepID=UPI002615E082|nr:hypothetical protein [uncultured Paraglaciecola sp.]
MSTLTLEEIQDALSKIPRAQKLPDMILIGRGEARKLADISPDVYKQADTLGGIPYKIVDAETCFNPIYNDYFEIGKFNQRDELDVFEWPSRPHYDRWFQLSLRTCINKEMQHFIRKHIPVHLMSKTEFTEFSWSDGDVIMFEDDLNDDQPIAWRVDGSDWVRINWQVGDEKYRQAIVMRKPWRGLM